MTYRFGEYELDEGRYELCRDGEPVPVEPKVLDLLLYLVRERHRLVSKQEILDVVWSGVHVTESTLTRAVSLARSAVGDSAHDPGVLETVTGRGYRWRAPVEVADGGGTLSVPPRRARRWGIGVAGAVMALALLGTFSWPRPLGWLLAISGSASPPVEPALPAQPSVVVLPFVDLSPGGGHPSLAEGLAEDLTWGLGRFPELFVVSRSSAMTYRDAPSREIVGRELGVRYAVEGSLRVVGPRSVVHAQLVEIETGRHVWGERLETSLDELLGVKATLAEGIVESLGARIQATELARLRQRPTRDFNAYELFLRGRVHFYAFTRRDHAEARRLFEQARALDPDYELATAYLGGIELAAYVLGWDPSRERLEAALALAERAHQMDSFEPMPYTLRAMASLLGGRGRQAVAAARRAVELGPNSDFCYGVKAAVAASEGKLLEAVRSLDRALRLNPRHPEFYWMLAGYLYDYGGQRERAAELFERIRLENPDLVPPRLALVLYRVDRSELEAARALVDEIRRVNPELTAQAALPIYSPARRDPAQAERALSAWRAAGLP